MKRIWLSVGLWIGLAGCGADTPELTLQTPDRMQFDAEVYPVLLRDCGFDACHASAGRFFQVFGPGRARLVPMTSAIDPLSDRSGMYPCGSTARMNSAAARST